MMTASANASPDMPLSRLPQTGRVPAGSAEERRLAQYSADVRTVWGATTFRDFQGMLDGTDETAADDTGIHDSWVGAMRSRPTTVISSTLEGPLDWPDATIAPGDAVETLRRLKEESDVPLFSHGSLRLNCTMLAAGLVDRLQVTIFPVVCGATGIYPILGGAGDLDLELLESRTLDAGTVELVYRPTAH